jgi:2-polyprenyl-6-methoxyphenol hydroxylase-like FAD-dependent oxidoreductase
MCPDCRTRSPNEGDCHRRAHRCVTTALALHRAGIETVVCEQDDGLRGLGVGTNLLHPAAAALGPPRPAGTARRHSAAHPRAGLRLPAGARDPAPALWPRRSPRRTALTPRPARDLLLAAARKRLGHGALRTGHRLTAFNQDASGVRAEFTDRDARMQDPLRGDVLVAADGIHSTVAGPYGRALCRAPHRRVGEPRRGSGVRRPSEARVERPGADRGPAQAPAQAAG